MLSAQQHRRQLEIVNLFGQLKAFFQAIYLFLGPLLDLIIRFYIAKLFFISGILKLTNWEAALYLAKNEYPIAWLDPNLAAYLGVGIEIIASVLLLLGLMTRLSALCMLMLSLTIQYYYQALNAQAFWIVLLAWYVIMGAGNISIDHALRGFKDSAILLSKPIVSLFHFLKNTIGPIYVLFIRISLAWLLYAVWQQQTFGLLRYQIEFSVLQPISQGTISPFLIVFLVLFLTFGCLTRFCLVLCMVLLTYLVWHHEMTVFQQTEYGLWMLLLASLWISGPLKYSLDELIAKKWKEWVVKLKLIVDPSDLSLPHVVIIGGGFGGVAAAKQLKNTVCRITLIDKHNYHLFQPLLYQVATAGLSPAEIAVPIRSLFYDQPNIKIVLDEVIGVNKEQKEVILKRGVTTHYDYLIIATGAMHSYFGKDKWSVFAPGLKTIEDAISVRQKLLAAFEKAENNIEPAKTEALLTFIVVGGGPTGIELAGSFAELAFHGMENEFRNISPHFAKIYLIEAGPRLLGVMHPNLSHYTQQALEALGVKVLLNTKVEEITESGVQVNDQFIPACNVFWAAGVQASSAAIWLQAEADTAGRIKVNKDLSVPGANQVYAVGDTVNAKVWHDAIMPGLAPAAKQSGKFVAKQIRALIEGKAIKREFKYQHYGSLATIGRSLAVVDFGAFRLKGAPAWWFWGAIHLYFLNNMKNRFLVMLQWFWSYITFKKSSRIIYEKND